MDREPHSGPYLGDHEHASRFQRFDTSLQDVPGAERSRRLRSQENVSRPDRDLNHFTEPRGAQRDFQAAVSRVEFDMHDAVVFPVLGHSRR
jgi:hypothetical protein